MKILETRRRVVGQKAFIGARVLFVWNSVPFTGEITSISIKSYGIKCDTSYHLTDILCIPRLGNEIYVPKINCKITDEISPIVYDIHIGVNHKVSGDVENAYHHLPKRTIYPWFGDTMKQIEFVPNKTIIKLDDGEYWYLISYTTMPHSMTTLISMKDYDTEYRIPNWKFQKNHCSTVGKRSKMVSELNIEKVYMIPENKNHKSVKELFISKQVNLMYDALSESHVLTTRTFREHGDVNPELLPKEVYYDFNIHTK